ncbi:MAG TPA: GtrA family protein [Candidatus Kapabacteria bacterium]|nr:GtrA family protein [Candidatus Kapabacteria bacterium]
MVHFLRYLEQTRFLHFLLVGGLNTIFGYALYAMFIACGLHYTVAVLFSTMLGIVFNFFTTGHFVFQTKNNRLFGRFVAVYTIVYVLNIVLIRLFQTVGMGDYVAGACAMPFVASVGFFLNKKYVFSSNSSSLDTRQSIADALNKIDTHEPLGTPLYDAIARHSVNVAFEAVWLRERNGEIEVFLKQRPNDATDYAGQWHVPGSVFRPGEQPEDVAKRIATEELHISHFSTISFVRFFFIPTTRRGWFESLVHLVQADHEPQEGNGQWYPVDRLPHPMIDLHQTLFIPAAVQYFFLQKK